MRICWQQAYSMLRTKILMVGPPEVSTFAVFVWYLLNIYYDLALTSRYKALAP